MSHGWWARARAVAQFELGIQRREPATVLYGLVFGLLTFAFVSSGAVELVRDRGALPKLSPLAITLAIGGLTAFGQVITTMVVASAILRDAAGRTDGLLGSTRLEGDAWLFGRWAASQLVLLGVSLAMVVGVMAGATAWWVPRDVSWGQVLSRALVAWTGLTAPTLVAIGTLLVVAASRTRRLLGVLGAALALLFVWQGTEALARRVAPDSNAGVAAALLDPFGTVAVQQVVAHWPAERRAVASVPLTGRVGAGRALWLLAATALLLVELRRTRRTGLCAGGVVAPRWRASNGAPPSEGRLPSGQGATSVLAAVAGFTHTWTWRERGWRIIAALGVLNVLAQAMSAPAGLDLAALVALIREHARLFLILLATIYAGELLWRDRDERVIELVASAPAPVSHIVWGRLLGLLPAQATLVGGLLLAGLAGALLRGEPVGLTPELLAAGVLWLWLPFVQWLWLSLAAHVLVRHKIVAHLLLITVWVAAVALDGLGVRSPWLRVADPPTLVAGTALPWGDALWRATWWSGVAAAAVLLAIWRWPRGAAAR